MTPPPAVAEALCCTAHTDSRPNSPQPFRRRHLQKPRPDGHPTAQKPLLDHHQGPDTSHASDDLIELQQIFAEAGSTLPPSAGPTSSMALLGQSPRPKSATSSEGILEEGNENKPKKRRLLKRLTGDLGRSNLSLSNLKKAAAAKDKAQKEQQQDDSGVRKVKGKKSKSKTRSPGDPAVEMNSVGPETREALLARAYDPDAASLPDIRDSVVERLTKKVSFPENGGEKARLSPIKSKSSTERRGDVSSIEWKEYGSGEPYGWGESSNSAPALSLHIPERLSDLGVLPSCNVSVEDLLQLSQPSGRNSPWKKFAEQHLRRRSKSADNLRPGTPDLKPTELPSLNSSFNSKGWRLSTDETPSFTFPFRELKHMIPEEKAQEEAYDESKPNGTHRFPNKAVFASAPTTNRSTDTAYRSVSEAFPDAEYRALSAIPGVVRRASLSAPPRDLPDSESASVHLPNMRISQHLRSDSTLSGASGTPTGETQQRPQALANRGGAAGSEPGVPSQSPLHTQQSDNTVRTMRKLRCSSSGFASERVPEGWGNVVSAAPSSVYEPSSVYSTRQNSLTSSSCTPGASSKMNIPTPYSNSGHGTVVRKSGYEVLNLGDIGLLRMDDTTVEEEAKAAAKGTIEESSTMPGAFPPSSSTNLLKRADTGLTFRTANEAPEAAGEHQEATEEKRSGYWLEGSSDHATDGGEGATLKPNQQSTEEPTDSSLDITPVTAAESPMSSEKTPRARIVTPTSTMQPSSAKPQKKTPSIKTPTKRFSTFSFFRSKTYSNLRRASHNSALHARKASRSEEHLVLDGSRDKAVKGNHGFDHHTDGPGDEQAPSESPEHAPARGTKQSMASDPIEERRPGRLSRSWLIGDGRSEFGQGAVWEKALQKHQEEKSALFLSPEKGGKAEARGLFRERSGSGSAISARSQQPDRKDKGKGPAITEDFTFGKPGPRLQRSPTMVLDPLETAEFGEELVRQRAGSGMLGDELRLSVASGSLTPATGISPGTSIKHEPSIVSIERELHVDSWGGTTLAEIDAGDLGPWSRFPSHTREQRTGAAGTADNVRTRDFAYEAVTASGTDNESSAEDEDNGKNSSKRLTTLRSKKRSKARSGMSKNKSMTFSRNFSFLKHYIGLFRSQSEEFRRYGHGHRSSVAESATLEHPELEMLPPVFSQVGFPYPESSTDLQTDGATSKADLRSAEDNPKTMDAEPKGKENKVEFQVQPNRREEGKTDSSDGSWAANARLFTRAFGSDSDGQKRAPGRKGDSSTEWRSNARTWTRFSTPSRDFQDTMDEARQRFAMTPTPLERHVEDSNDTAAAATSERGASSDRGLMAMKRLPRTTQSSSEEWRSDARLFSQMYESCVQIPKFGSFEEANAGEASGGRPGLPHRHQQSSSSVATLFRRASTGHIDGIVAQAGVDKGEKVKIRAVSGSYGEAAGKGVDGFARNDSFLSIGSAEGTTMDLMRFLHELEEGERAKLEGEKGGEV